MSFSDLPLLRPTINLKAANPQFAIYGHILSLIAGFFLVVSGFFNFLSDPLALIAVVTGIIIMIIELDQFSFPPLKEAINRGVAWIVLGSVSVFGIDFLPILLIFVGGACYIAYSYQ